MYQKSFQNKHFENMNCFPLNLLFGLLDGKNQLNKLYKTNDDRCLLKQSKKMKTFGSPCVNII